MCALAETGLAIARSGYLSPPGRKWSYSRAIFCSFAITQSHSTDLLPKNEDNYFNGQISILLGYTACRFGLDHPIQVDPLIAVGRELRVWVEDCHRPGAEVQCRDRTAIKRSSALLH